MQERKPMINKNTNKILFYGYWFVCLVPVIWILFISINYLITYIDLGRLPRYGSDSGFEIELKSGREIYPIPFSGILNIFLMNTTIWCIFYLPLVVIGHFVIGLLVKSFPKLTLHQALISYLGCALYLLLWEWMPFAKMMMWYLG